MSNHRESGLTLIELLVSLAFATIIFAGLSSVMGQATNAYESVDQKIELTRDAQFAMDRMVKAISHSRLLLLPMADKPISPWPENVREQSVPATAPTNTVALHTAVLAVTLPEYIDLNGDGVADADDDEDGQIDEDLPADNHNDNASGIYLIDDNGDGSVDEFDAADDDETANDIDDDILDGVDNDNDNNIDEDPGSDNNGDGCPGICGVDDDGSGQVDEGSSSDDDEDGEIDEDPYNPLVFVLSDNELIERIPVPWDIDGNASLDGRDFYTTTIAENVTYFRVERVVRSSGESQQVEITLELTSPQSQETIRLNTRVRLGAAL